MLLTDELIDRIHRVNKRAIQSVAEAASKILPAAAGKEIAGGMACFAGEGSPFTQLSEYRDEAGLEEVEAFFSSRCENWEITPSSFASPGALGALSKYGYVADHFESVLAMDIGRVPEVGDVDIEEITGDRTEWMLTAERGWTEDDESESISDVSRIVATLEDTRFYLARVEGIAAAVASMQFEDGLICLSGACTRVPFRGRGLQTALINRRLRDAGKGALAVMSAAPGSASHRNAQRHGLHPLYSKLVFMRRAQDV